MHSQRKKSKKKYYNKISWAKYSKFFFLILLSLELCCHVELDDIWMHLHTNFFFRGNIIEYAESRLLLCWNWSLNLLVICMVYAFGYLQQLPIWNIKCKCDCYYVCDSNKCVVLSLIEKILHFANLLEKYQYTALHMWPFNTLQGIYISKLINFIENVTIFRYFSYI